MSRTQRLSFLVVAAVVAVIAVVVIIVAGGSSDSSGSSSSSSSGKVVTLEPGSVKKLKYTQGDQVTFKVHSPKADVVHVHGYNIERPVKANGTITLSFKASINGIFDIEVHSTDSQIGQLTVEPK